MLNKMGIFFYRVYKAASNIEFTWLLQQPLAGKTRCSVCSWGSWGQCLRAWPQVTQQAQGTRG